MLVFFFSNMPQDEQILFLGLGHGKDHVARLKLTVGTTGDLGGGIVLHALVYVVEPHKFEFLRAFVILFHAPSHRLGENLVVGPPYLRLQYRLVFL